MTIASLLIGTIISQILFAVTKVIFIGSLNTDSWAILIAFFLLLIVETIAVVRRMGTLNYIESFFLASVWLIALLIVDFIITSRLIEDDIYKKLYYWMTYLAIILALIVFHKKLHVEVRKANANK